MRRALVLIAILMTLWPRVVWADNDRARAEALMKEGKALAEQDKEAEAYQRFRAAYEAYQSANILFVVATSEQKLGKSLLALRHYREAVKKGTLDDLYAQQSKGYIAELESKLGRFIVKAPTGATLALDGAPYEGSLNDPIDVEAGDHLLEATLSGKTTKTKATAIAGKEVPVLLDIDPGPTEPPPSGGGPDTSGGHSTGMIVLAGGLGTGAVVAGVLGFVFRGSATGAVDDAKSLPPTGDCRGSTMPDCMRAADLRSDRDSAWTASTVSFVAAGALAVGAGVVTALILRGGHRDTARLAPIVGPGSGGASLHLSF